MVDLERIKQLVELMVDNDLGEIRLRDGEEEISLKRAAAHTNSSPTVGGVTVNPPPSAPPVEAADAEEISDVELHEITSPMVGTYYAASSPEAPPFVQPGKTVDRDTIVCVIEAMKVFNEIKAGVAGVIEKVLVANEQPVEFGQPLIAVRPA